MSKPVIWLVIIGNMFRYKLEIQLMKEQNNRDSRKIYFHLPLVLFRISLEGR